MSNVPTSPVDRVPAIAILRSLSADLVVAAVLLIGSAGWATTFWNTFVAQGGAPVFYQDYFEPAVMVACGRGFVIAQEPAPPSLEDFLKRRRDTFECGDLPANLKVGREGLYQGAWIYLLTTVGWSWRLLGVSWSGMGPLFGFLFSVTIALSYGIFRLGMSRPLAVLGSLGLTVSAAHLMNLPNLRDYAKAPFTLALVFLIGLVVTLPVRRRTLLLVCATYGAVLGIGYGFRTDFLANLPVLPLVLFAFLEGGVTKRLALKAAATAVSIAMFVVVSWPALTAVYDKGGCQWHVALLGLQAPFDPALHVTPAPYDFGYAYSDGYIDWTVRGYANRADPSLQSLAFCSHEYDVQSGRYLSAIVAGFPGDIVTRAYGSVSQVAELPFLWWASPMPGWLQGFYDARAALLRPRIGLGIYILAIAVLIGGSASVRLGFFLLFFAAYFGGYPALQFQTRHHFHLEFMTWWAFGFIIQRMAALAWASRRGVDWKAAALGARPAAVFAVSAIAVIVGVLGIARWYQQGRAIELFRAYIASPRVPLESGDTLPPLDDRAWPQFLEVELNQAACGPQPSVTFRHNVTPMDGDLSRTFTIVRPSTAPGVTRIFLPVFRLFKNVEFSDDRPGCFVGAYRVAELSRFPLLLGAVLPPDWEAMRLSQRLQDWETGGAVHK